MRTNSVPYSDQPPGATPDNTRVGNFIQDDSVANGYDDGYAVTGSTSYSSSQNYLTDVGAYSLSPSYYGTFDQGGNAWEWNEAKVTLFARGLRGGAWSTTSFVQQAWFRVGANFPSGESIGFRVAMVPEPGTLLLVAMASLGLLLRRRALR
jgi:hypothetical protein